MEYEKHTPQEVSPEIFTEVVATNKDLEEKVAGLNTELLDASLKKAIRVRDSYKELYERSINSVSEDEAITDFIGAMETLMGTIDNTEDFESEIGLRKSQQIGESQE